MSERMKDFLVGIGFVVDEASQRRAQQAVANHEKAVTTITDEAGQTRMDREAFRQQIAAKGNDLTKVRIVEAEKKTAAAVVKVQKDSTDRIARIDTDAHKKAAERRTVAFKDISKGAVQMEAVLTRVAGLAGMVGGALTGTSFFQGILGAAGNYAAAQQQSMRTGSSVRGIQALLYGFSQVGVSREEANSSFEGFRSYLVRNPGIKTALRKAGVDADGDPATAFSQLGRYFQTMPYNVQLGQAERFGISENTLRALENPDLAGKIAEGAAKPGEFGLDPDKAAKDGQALTAAYGRMATDLQIIKDKVTVQFFEPMMKGFNGISDWLEQHPDAAGKFAQGMVGFAALMSVRVVPTLLKLAGAITGISGALASLPAWVLALLGADAATHSLNKGEGDIRSDGIHMPDGTVRPNSIFNPDAQGDRLAPGSGIALPRNESRLGRAYRQRPKWLGGEGKGGARERLGYSGDADATGTDDPLKKFIARHEGAGYDVVYGHAERGGPLAPPKPITQMTIGEILAYQRQMKPRSGALAFPVGRAQWTESTLRGLTRDMDPNTVFTPEVQEKLFDRSIAGRMDQGPQGFRSEWDSLRNVSDADISAAIEGHRNAVAAAKSAVAYYASDSKGNRVAVDAQGRAIGSDGRPTTVGKSPFGGLDPVAIQRMTAAPAVTTASPSSMYSAYDNSRRGDTNFNQTVSVTGVNDPAAVASHVKLSAERGSKDFVRNLQGATQ